MKGPAILLLTIFMLVRPLWPVFEYVVNYDYIVNVLCENRSKPQLECDGKCYLSKQLSKESEKNQQNPFGENQVRELPQILDTTLEPDAVKDQLFHTEINKKFWPKPNFHALLFVFEINHPPEI